MVPGDLVADEGNAGGVELVERAELAVRVPPAVGELAEFLHLPRVRVHRPILAKKSPAEAGPFFT